MVFTCVHTNKTMSPELGLSDGWENNKKLKYLQLIYPTSDET